MSAITFDTYKVVKRLTSEGISERQAAAIVEAIQESSEIDKNTLATKADLKADLAELKAELIKWMFGGFIAIVGLLVTILLKLH